MKRILFIALVLLVVTGVNAQTQSIKKSPVLVEASLKVWEFLLNDWRESIKCAPKQFKVETFPELFHWLPATGKSFTGKHTEWPITRRAVR